MKLRDVVKKFAQRMEATLRKHDDDPERGPRGWIDDDPRDLLVRVHEEVEEVQTALDRLGRFEDYLAHADSGVPVAGRNRRSELVEAVLNECADVANTAMMVADVVTNHVSVNAPEPPPPAKKMTVLEEAASVVDGPRQADYGHPSINHARTAMMWSAYLGIPVSSRDVCMLNVLQKVSRDRNRPKRDNPVDIAGWARNAEMCEEPVKAEFTSHR